MGVNQSQEYQEERADSQNQLEIKEKVNKQQIDDSDINYKLNLMDEDEINVKNYLLTYFSLDLDLKRLDYQKLQKLIIKLQNEQQQVIEHIAVYIENNLYKYDEISEKFSEMQEVIEQSDKINEQINQQIDNKIQSYEEQSQQIQSNIDNYLVNKYNHVNLSEIYETLLNFDNLEKKSNFDEQLSIDEKIRALLQISRQYKRNNQTYQQLKHKYQDNKTEQIRDIIKQYEVDEKIVILKQKLLILINDCIQLELVQNKQQLVNIIQCYMNLDETSQFIAKIFDVTLQNQFQEKLNKLDQSVKFQDLLNQILLYIDEKFSVLRELMSEFQEIDNKLQFHYNLFVFIKENIFMKINQLYFINESYVDNYTSTFNFFNSYTDKYYPNNIDRRIIQIINEIKSKFNINIYLNIVKQQIIQKYESNINSDEQNKDELLIDCWNLCDEKMDQLEVIKKNNLQFKVMLFNRHVNLIKQSDQNILQDLHNFKATLSSQDQNSLIEKLVQLLDQQIINEQNKIIKSLKEESKSYIKQVYNNINVKLQYKNNVSSCSLNLILILQPLMKMKSFDFITNDQLIRQIKETLIEIHEYQQLSLSLHQQSTQIGKLMDLQFSLDNKQIQQIISDNNLYTL